MFFRTLITIAAILSGGIASIAGFGIGSIPTAIALIVDGARMPAHGVMQGRQVLEIWPLLVLAIIGVVAETIVGERLLRRIPEPVFRRVVSSIILVLGISLLLHPGKG